MKRTLVILSGLFVCVSLAIQPAVSKEKRKQKPVRAEAAKTWAKPKTIKKKSSVEVKLGVSMMYDWWQPAYLKLSNGMTGNLFSRKYKSDTDGSFMLGPSLEIKIGDTWNIGLTGLFGCSKNQLRHSTIAVEANFLNFVIPDGIINPYIDRGIIETRRYDVDLNVERAMLKYLNLLFGARFSYQDTEGYSMRESSLYFPISKIKDDYTVWYVGPSVGAGFHYEINGFSIKAGVSALFQFGYLYLERYNINPLLLNFNFISDEFIIAHLSIGADCGLKLAYFIKKISLEVWVGGRYIILPHISVKDIDSAFNAAYKKGWITGKVEQFGGLTFGASYRF
jgi:hypothetical protein